MINKLLHGELNNRVEGFGYQPGEFEGEHFGSEKHEVIWSAECRDTVRHI